MFNNVTCMNFKNTLDNLISNSHLPPVVAYYIIKDSLNELSNICEEVLNYEKSIPEQEKQKEDIEFFNKDEIKEKKKIPVIITTEEDDNIIKADQQES